MASICNALLSSSTSVIYHVSFFLLVEDLERNDGSPDRPFLMNKSLRKILNKQNVEMRTQ